MRHLITANVNGRQRELSVKSNQTCWKFCGTTSGSRARGKVAAWGCAAPAPCWWTASL